MKIKLRELLVCILLIIPTVSFSTVAVPDSEKKMLTLKDLPLPLFPKSVDGLLSNLKDAPTFNISYKIDPTSKVINKFCEIIGIGTIGFGWPLIPITMLFAPVGIMFGAGQISAYNGTNEPWTLKGGIGFIVIGFTGIWLNTIAFWMVIGRALFISAGYVE